MVQRTYAVMSNDVLISIPLFVFMGYLVERRNLIEKLFQSAAPGARAVPASLAVATIVHLRGVRHRHRHRGAVVTLMGCWRCPAMLRAATAVKVSAGANHRRRLPGHPDPPVGDADRLRRHGRRVGGAAVRRRVLPRDHAGRLYVLYVIVLAKLRPA
jgi:TRAP-type mannitol/chloroaromatic compound transport system permease large subunit